MGRSWETEKGTRHRVGARSILGEENRQNRVPGVGSGLEYVGDSTAC